MRAFLILAIASTLAACGPSGNGPPQGGMPPAEVVVLTVQPKAVLAPFEYTGQIAASREVEVRARVTGILLSRHFTEGGPVRKGQSLYTIDAAPLQAAFARAEADVGIASATSFVLPYTLSYATSPFISHHQMVFRIDSQLLSFVPGEMHVLHYSYIQIAYTSAPRSKSLIAQENMCSSYGVRLVGRTETTFLCPSCGRATIGRCMNCRDQSVHYKCPACGFVGP